MEEKTKEIEEVVAAGTKRMIDELQKMNLGTGNREGDRARTGYQRQDPHKRTPLHIKVEAMWRWPERDRAGIQTDTPSSNTDPAH